MTTAEKIEQDAKNTVGYAEAENKRSFIVGVQVAIGKSEDIYEKRIRDLETSRDFYKRQSETMETELKTIVKIFNKYNYE